MARLESFAIGMDMIRKRSFAARLALVACLAAVSAATPSLPAPAAPPSPATSTARTALGDTAAIAARTALGDTAAIAARTAVGGTAAIAARTALGGTAAMTVTTFDYCGGGAQRRLTGRFTYRLPAQLEIAAPGPGDRNPYSFFLAAGPVGVVGSIALYSAAVVAAPSGRLLLTYWRLSTDGRNVSGVLTDTHLAEGAPVNAFTEQQLLVPCRPELGQLPPWPGPLATGTQMRGSVANGHANLSVAGATTDGMTEILLHFVG